VKLQQLPSAVRMTPNTRPQMAQPATSWRAGTTSSTARGYTYRWQKEGKAFLELHPLCQCADCDEGRKRLLPATVVDHRIPHRGDMRLFWDRSNWQAMSKPCHDRKTQQETAQGL
jgi:5-methylcytosine-specific restriction protein A